MSHRWVQRHGRGFVINDVSRYLDPRDAPADWPYGFFPNSGNSKLIPSAIAAASPANPLEVPTASWMRSNTYPLNPKLAAWAYAQTKGLNLGDDPKVAAYRAGFTGFPEAQKPPFVLMGDTFASDDYWHGPTMTKFAEDWVRLYTHGKGTFAMTEMEDAGFMNAIERLSAMHRVDADRVMVLRTASNYSMPLPGSRGGGVAYGALYWWAVGVGVGVALREHRVAQNTGRLAEILRPNSGCIICGGLW